MTHEELTEFIRNNTRSHPREDLVDIIATRWYAKFHETHAEPTWEQIATLFGELEREVRATLTSMVKNHKTLP